MSIHKEEELVFFQRMWTQACERDGGEQKDEKWKENSRPPSLMYSYSLGV